MKGRSLRLRLLLAGAAAVIAALTLATFGLTALFAYHVERRAVDQLSVQLDQILSGIERDATGALVAGAALADARFSIPLGGLYWQIEAEGQQLRSRSLWDFALSLPADHLSDGAVHVHDLPGPRGAQVLAMERKVILPVRLGSTEIRAAVAMEAGDLARNVAEFRADLVPLLALLGGFLILAGAVQVSVGLRPLKAVGRRVARVRSGRAARVGEDFPTEILPLAAEVDALLTQREAEIAHARQRAGDLAHGLKTPLQALLGEAGRLRAAGQGAAADAIEQIADTMHANVNRELALVRVSTRGRVGVSDLAEVVDRLVAVVGRVGTHSQLQWEVDIATGLRVAADAEDLSEIIGALLENAARYTSTGVRITGRIQGQTATLSIMDDGPGIPPDRIEALMQRGMRADQSGPGTGLGLAIAREVTMALGGELHLEPRNPGLRVRVILPLATG